MTAPPTTSPPPPTAPGPPGPAPPPGPPAAPSSATPLAGILESLQARVDDVTTRARKRPNAKTRKDSVLTEDDIDFLRYLYGAIGEGGRLVAPEAAQLMRRYLSPTKTGVEDVDSGIYESSKAVQREMVRHHALISDAMTSGRLSASGGTEYAVNGVANKTEACGALRGGARPTHLLVADDERLQKANNRFYVQSYSRSDGSSIWTRYVVTDCYSFEPFSAGLYTNLTLLGQTLRIEDGLSEYLTRVGLAKVFTYESTWGEVWDAPKRPSRGGR